MNLNVVTVIIKTTGNQPSQNPKYCRLNLKDNLIKIREKLESENIIDNTLLFSRKFSENNNSNDEFAEIANKYEEDSRLDDVVYKSGMNYILYLTKSSKISWDFLNELRKLDYGCTMTSGGIKKANKRAFKMKNCELTELGAEGCQKGAIEIKSDKDLMMMRNLFFSAEVDAKNFAKLGLSVGKSKKEESSFKADYSYNFTKYGKASLKFSEYLEPTQEFIKAVEDAIKSKGPEKFKQITEEFGQFIPTEVILGGRAHFNEHLMSTGHSAENSNEIAMDVDSVVLKNKITYSSNYGEGKSTYCKLNCSTLIGGKPPNSLENFDEETWAKSLKEDYKNWDCIEFRNPVNIFKLLPDNLRKQVIISVGKRILHSAIEDFDHRIDQLEEFGRPKIFELKDITSDISKILQNKDADCNIFATVIDTTELKNGFFNCQVLCPPNGKPSLIIHCVQKNFKKCISKLKIRWMVLGYDTDFSFILSDFNSQLDILKNDFNALNNQTTINKELLNFEYDSYKKVPPCLGIAVLSKLDSSNDSLVIGHYFFNAQEENKEKNKIGAYTFSYCLKNNRYVNSINFTFHTLIISDYYIHNAYDTIPFENRIMKKPYINLNNRNPKFISLYSTQKTNYGPIYLKQKNKLIKVKYMNCKCKTCSICKNGTKMSDNYILRCAFFDPCTSVNVYDLN